MSNLPPEEMTAHSGRAVGLSAEQGDVQPWRENVERVRAMISVRLEDLQSSSWASRQQSIDAALDALTTQIEELERERDEAVKERDDLWAAHDTVAWHEYMATLEAAEARAEKAERALAENEQPWEDMRAYNIRLEERARKAERALAEIARLSPFVSPEDDNSIRKAPAIARAALRASEEVIFPNKAATTGWDDEKPIAHTEGWKLRGGQR